MSKKHSYTLEKHIYVEKWSGFYRFKVVVAANKKDSGTFSTKAEGAAWARRRRQEFLDDLQPHSVSPVLVLPAAVVPVFGFPAVHSIAPPIRLEDVFDGYERLDLPKLTGQQSEKSPQKTSRVFWWAYH